MKWDINYLGFKGEVVETINYKNIIEFEKEIRDCYNTGAPIDFKYVEGEKEIER